MSENNFQNFLYIDSNKFLISVYQQSNFKNLYFNEFSKKNYQNNLSLDELEIFLNQNIFKIEKSLNTFVKDINFIIEHKDLLSVDISIKKNNNGNEITLTNIKHSLNEIMHQFKDSFKDKTIIHMLINKYLIDGKEFFENAKKFTLSIFFFGCYSYIIIQQVN